MRLRHSHQTAEPAPPSAPVRVQPRTLILRTAGTNCDGETAFAFERAGSIVQRVHLNRVLENPAILRDYQIMAIPGGFSYGDDIAAGRIFASQLRNRLSDAMRQFVEARKPIIGICNGFQVLIKTDLLPGPMGGSTGESPAGEKIAQSCTLGHNDCGRFVDRWVRLASPAETRCIWTRKLQPLEPPAEEGASPIKELRQLELPIAHGEGKFIPVNEQIRKGLWDNQQVALVYAAPDGSAAQPSSVDNPNGSIDGIAGICDATGLIFGLMPHPERFIDPMQHPNWFAGQFWGNRHFLRLPEGAGLQIFQSAVEHVIQAK